MIKHEYKAGEILELTKTARAKAEEQISQVQGDDAVVQFDNAVADLLEATKPAKFMRFVHHDAAIRDDAMQADKMVADFLLEVTSREKLYEILENSASTSPVIERLKKKTLVDFKHRGLGLPKETQARITELQQRLTDLEREFEKNIAEANDYIEVEDIAGLPELLTQRLGKRDGKYRISTNASEYMPVMQYAKNPAVRKLMQSTYENRAGEVNTMLLNQAIVIRKELAELLGYKNWLEFRTEAKMAKNEKTVRDFLENLRHRLAARNLADLKRLEERKHKEIKEKLHPWDALYYETIIKREELALDEEKLREYFPAEHVIKEMFGIYSKLLGITITQRHAQAWSQNVQYYDVHDRDGRLISNFYTDFYPRPNKYEHAAAFTLRPGRIKGTYVTPISAIVCNFAPPTNDTPALLSHDEVETLFHEFGHIMHQGLTTAPYSYLSGTNVPTDFVEMPSQIMEHWVWDAQILKQVSSHYKTGEPLPDEFIERLIATRHFNEARVYTRQVLLALYDFTLHTQYADPIETWKRLYKEIGTLDPLPNTHWPAGFGHLMGGYDAGYYSYLWSKVYADDLFTRFRRDGLMNPEAGYAYRRLILEPGDTRDQMELMTEFLGRKPSSDAFFELMG